MFLLGASNCSDTFVKSVCMQCNYTFTINVFSMYRDYESQTNEDGSRLKPWISLSGDDDGKHYILYPQTEDKDDWKYDIETIIETGIQIRSEKMAWSVNKHFESRGDLSKDFVP